MRSFFASVAAGTAVAVTVGSVRVEATGHNNGTCAVCHIQNEGFTKNVASPENFACNPHNTCAQYTHNSCCTWNTALLVGAPGGLNAALYGSEWGYERCGIISEACNEYLQHEACFYECDVNVGRYRYHPKSECSEGGIGNAWQIANIPIKKSFCDEFFDACKADIFCAAEDATESASIFDAASLTCGASECGRTVEEIWGTAKNFCENSFSSDGIPSFLYEVNETAALTMHWTGDTNPNDDVPGMPDFPEEQCDLYNGTWAPSLDECLIEPSEDCSSEDYAELEELTELLQHLEATRNSTQGGSFLEDLGSTDNSAKVITSVVVLGAVAANLV